MVDDGGGNPLLWLLAGFLVGDRYGSRPARGHTHGDHWHEHPSPGWHVHDGGLDGPVRPVDPPRRDPEEVRGCLFLVVLAVLFLVVLVTGGWGWAVVYVAALSALVVIDQRGQQTSAPEAYVRAPRPGEAQAFYRFERFELRHVHIAETYDGRLDVSATLKNLGPDRAPVAFEVTLSDGGRAIGRAFAEVERFGAGDLRVIRFLSDDPFRATGDIGIRVLPTA